MTHARAAQILEEWFGDLTAGPVTDERRQRWFAKNPEFDEHIRETYEEDVRRGLAGDYDEWTATAAGSLALVILLDQFTRNMYRGTDRMYCGDDKAGAVADGAIEAGLDAALRPVERQFLYMPLMHAEALDCQERCVSAFERLAAESDVNAVEWAIRHRDIVARFGRFPHRNELLGRESTAEELRFLEQPNSSF